MDARIVAGSQPVGWTSMRSGQASALRGVRRADRSGWELKPPFPRARTWHRSMDARSMMCRSARVYLVVGHPRPLPRAMPNATCRTHGPALRARPRDPGPSGNQPHLHGAVDVFHRSPGRGALPATRPLTRRGRMPGAWRGMRLGDLSAAASRRHDRYDPRAREGPVNRPRSQR